LVGDSISRLVGAAVRKDEGVVLGEGTTARRAVGYPITTHAKAAHNTKAREFVAVTCRTQHESTNPKKKTQLNENKWTL